MKILKKIGLFILALIALVLIAGLIQSRDYNVEREITIGKPKQQVFDYIKMLRNQNSYSKWAMMDPNMKKDFRGIDGTTGFVSSWEGNDDVGKGEQEIKSIAEGERMDTEIRFEKPFKSVAASYMITEAAGEGQTIVKWGFSGRMPYPMNALKMIAGRQIGKDLQTGLNNLKANLEKQ
jgi:hypothetical protein